MDSKRAESEKLDRVSEYVRSVFALAGREIPAHADAKPDWMLAFSVACHFAAMGQASAYAEWEAVRYPPTAKQQYPWPAWMEWPPGSGNYPGLSLQQESAA